MYIIKRTDQRGGWLAKQGSEYSYTNNLHLARTFHTVSEAQSERCPSNEIVVNLDTLMLKNTSAYYLNHVLPQSFKKEG